MEGMCGCLVVKQHERVPLLLTASSSTSTVTNIIEGYLSAISQKAGVIALHGPHHDALKFTTTYNNGRQKKLKMLCIKNSTPTQTESRRRRRQTTYYLAICVCFYHLFFPFFDCGYECYISALHRKVIIFLFFVRLLWRLSK